VVRCTGAGCEHAVADLEAADHAFRRHLTAGVERPAIEEKDVAVALTFGSR
jgi:hypothetical protein